MNSGKFKQVVDGILLKVGLVRNSKHQSIVESWKNYTNLLGEAAKEKGVNLLFDNEYLSGIVLDTDLFLLGNRNHIIDCEFIGTTIKLAPSCSLNLLQNNRFIANLKVGKND